MSEYIIKRLLQSIPAIFGVTIVVFLLLHASGDSAQMALGTEATKEALADYRKAWGLDKPLHIQYYIFISNALLGNFGYSMVYNEPVGQLILGRLPPTLWLASVSTFISILIGVPAGIIAAMRRNSSFDPLLMVGTVIPWLERKRLRFVLG